MATFDIHLLSYSFILFKLFTKRHKPNQGLCLQRPNRKISRKHTVKKYLVISYINLPLLKANKTVLKTTIHHLAHIRSGLTTYRKASINGQAIYLNARLFNRQGHFISIIDQDLRDLRITPRTERYLLEPNDVLFAAKGEKNFATVYDPAIGPAVASATFFVLRLRSEFSSQIDPYYLAWLLNHPSYLRILKSQALGSTPPSISKKTLQQLDVHLPSLPKQQAVLAIDRLQKRRDTILQRIRTLKSQLTSTQLLIATS